jgi:hypothetical protein
MKPRVTTYLVAVAALAVGYLWGFASYKFEWFPFYAAKSLLRVLMPGDASTMIGFNRLEGRAAVACSDLGTRPLVVLTFGQSNAANSGDRLLGELPTNLYNFNVVDGRCYVAKEPLLGATGDGGSTSTRLGVLLAAEDRRRNVLLAPIAVSGSSMQEWTRGGEHYSRLSKTIGVLAQHSLSINAALWQQGESDSGTSADQYVEWFSNMLSGMRDLGYRGPVIVAHSTRCHGAPHAAVRAANEKLAAARLNVHQGPDLDAFTGPEYRYDGCHFNERGQSASALQWQAALHAAMER